MKVVHIISSLSRGGAERALFRLATSEKNKNDVSHYVVSLGSKGYYGDILKLRGIPVVCLEINSVRTGLVGIFRLYFLLRRERPEVVQTWMYHADLFGGVIARLVGIPKVYWGIMHYNLSRGVTPLTTIMIAKFCALSSNIIPTATVSCSSAAIDVHKKFGYSGEFLHIPLGFDLEELDFSPIGRHNLRLGWGLHEKDFVLGCVARWDLQKDHKTLISALKLVLKVAPSVKLVLAGPKMEPSNEELVSLLNYHGLSEEQVIKVGIVEDISSLMSSFDLHVLSSLGEAFPNVVAEAMSCQTPCIVTDVGDCALIVGELGWCVEPGDSVSLSTAILESFESWKIENNWIDRRVGCRRSIKENFGLEKMVVRYHSAWTNFT